MNILEQGVFKRFEDGSERRNRLVVQAREAEAQLIASQLATEGIVVLDPRSDSFLGRLGRAVSPYKKEAALFASAVLAFVATSCGGEKDGVGGAESPPPAAIPTVTELAKTPTFPFIDPTPTAEAQKPTPTPEPEFKFGEYDVFSGEVEGGGKVVFAALPNGKLLFQAAKPEVTCDNPKNTLYKFLVAPPYTPGGFNYSSRISIEGTLTSATTVAGQMSNKEHFVNTSDGRIKCSANSFPFTAQRVGKGREAFLDNYKKVMGYPINTMSNKEVEELINRAIKLYGFELP